MINPNHFFKDEPECMFCGCFGPTEEDQPCVTRNQIGKQVAFLIDKLRRIRDLSNRGVDLGFGYHEQRELIADIYSITLELPKWDWEDIELEKSPQDGTHGTCC